MRALYALAALLALCEPATAAVARRAVSQVSPVVTPGASQPSVSRTSSNVTITASYNDITAASHGNPSDYGYGLRGFIRWDDMQMIEVGASGVAGSRQIGLFASHIATDDEKAAGQVNNIDHVNVRCDGGSWVTITAPSQNYSAGGTVDWNFTVNSQDYADGLHKCDVVAVPRTGPDVLGEGPLKDEWGNGNLNVALGGARIDSGVLGTPGNILTLSTSAALAVSYGMSVSMIGVAPNTFIDGDSQTNPTACVAQTGANCTGAGGAGTYHVTGSAQAVYGAVFTGSISGTTLTVPTIASGNIIAATVKTYVFGAGVAAGTTVSSKTNSTSFTVSASQTVGSETMYASAPASFNYGTSFWFVTDYNNTLGRGQHVIFLCPTTCAGVAGSDGNAGTSSAPVQTYVHAVSLIASNDTQSNQKGVWGGVVCVMGGQTVTPSGAFTATPSAKLGWVRFESASGPHCGLNTDPGGADIAWTGNSLTDRSYVLAATMFSYINLSGGALGTAGASPPKYLAADHAAMVNAVIGNGGMFQGSGVLYCVESVVWFGANGACGSQLARNLSAKYVATGGNGDGLNGNTVAVGNTIDGVGLIMEWTSVSTTAGSNVITVAILPPELQTRSLSSMFAGLTNLNVYIPDTQETGCFSQAVKVLSIDDAAHTITVGDPSTGNPVSATTSCSNAWLGTPGAHSDNIQLSQASAFDDTFLLNNSFNQNYTTYSQGAFLESYYQSGIDMEGNSFNADPAGTESMLNNNGSDELVLYRNNTYTGPATSSYRQDVLGNSNHETFIGDQCVNGGTFGGLGSNIRRTAAASDGCYTTTSP